MQVSNEEIAAMKARLKNRQEERRAEADIDEVIALVGKRRFFPEAPAPAPEAKSAADPEQKMICHEVLEMARKMKTIEDVFRIAVLVAWAAFSCMAFVSWRTGFGSPGAWLAMAEICLMLSLEKVPGEVKGGC